ncbi:MAG: SpoIID/LytB domain-containing protein [Chlamydiae bacterium]|nr:SpoIID/LytB domain-containing protein [Chlamydiota bacterium]
MKFLLTSLLILFSSKLMGNVFFPTDISQKNKPATIKVLLIKEAENILLEAKGKYLIYNPENQLLIDSGFLGKKEKVFSDENGIHWGSLFRKIFHMRIVPRNNQSRLLVDNLEYKGCLEIYAVNDKIHIVNEVDIENYIKSTLSSEFVGEKNESLLEAVSIVARTNSYALAKKDPNATWHLEGEKEGYFGLANCTAQVVTAVEKTRHLILVFEEEPFSATWTKDSGGKTASYSSIFRKPGNFPPGVISLPAQFFRENHRWTFQPSKEDFCRIFEIEELKKLELFQDEQSSKIYGLRISSNTDSKDLDFFQLQQILGKENIKSNDFIITVTEQAVQFSGYGEGHGVGLCLESTDILLKRNLPVPKILETFFPNTHLVRHRNLVDFSLKEDPKDHIW